MTEFYQHMYAEIWIKVFKMMTERNAYEKHRIVCNLIISFQKSRE